MKKLLLSIFAASFAFNVYPKQTTGEDVLALARSNLPSGPIKLTGTVQTETKSRKKITLPVEIELNYSADTPSAIYRFGKPGRTDYQWLTVIWRAGRPDYMFSNPANQASSTIPGTNITWQELSYSFLWWPNPKLLGEEKKNGRKCYIVNVPVPGTDNSMRLWIDKKEGLLQKTRTFDRQQRELSRFKVMSTKRRNGDGLAINVETQNRATGSRSTLIVSKVDWPSREPTQIIDPVRSNNQLAFDLYKELISENDSNLILSPYSIFSAAAMTYCGARGATAEQMNRVLRLGRLEETPPACAYLNLTLRRHEKAGDIKLNIANGIWHQQGREFHPEYLGLIHTFYSGNVQPADFKSNTETVREEINGWVEEQTHDKIKNLITPGSLSPDTQLALINAIYFKGDWASKFKAYITSPKPFYLMDGTTNTVQMMAQKEQFGYGENEYCQILDLPYKSEEFSMLALLPKGNHTLNTLEENLSIHILTGQKLREREVRVKFPKFEIESSFGLSRILSELGMPLAFDPQRADFSGISTDGPLGIDSAVHKAIITVGEEGTEAAAATSYTVFGGSVQTIEPKEFFADHPFLFLIRENSTGTILFIGRVMDPSK